MRPLFFMVLSVPLFFSPAFSGLAADTLPLCAIESGFIKSGLVDVCKLDSSIKVELKYACSTNFMGADVYGGLQKCYLQPKAAKKLAEASRLLRMRNPELSLLVVDGTRPRHVQRRMWELVRGTSRQKYVANPLHGSMHNFGCAVDLTLIDKGGNRLDMGTPMDYFGALAEPRQEISFLRQGKLTPEHIANRRILREAMVGAGFVSLAIEWWHFDAFKKTETRSTYSIVE